jgi:hypothetical protein
MFRLSPPKFDMMMMIASMVWDNISDLRPPTVIYITRVIYEHREQWWNDAERGKIQIRPLELSGNPTSSHMAACRRNGRRNDEFDLAKEFCSYLQVMKFWCGSGTNATNSLLVWGSGILYCNTFLKKDACCVKGLLFIVCKKTVWRPREVRLMEMTDEPLEFSHVKSLI